MVPQYKDYGDEETFNMYYRSAHEFDPSKPISDSHILFTTFIKYLIEDK